MHVLVTAPVWVALWHLGSLHAYEKMLVALVAFGPFVVLVALVFYLRRRDARDAHDEG
jgi:hypothetical protein